MEYQRRIDHHPRERHEFPRGVRLKERFVAFMAVSIVHSWGALVPLLAQPEAGRPAGAHNQERIQTTVEKTLPTVVSFIGAAGVIISPEGLVLSQAHVTHPDGAKPGAKFTVWLQDATAAEAELLGADRLHDVALVRLTKPGPYPFTPLADRDPAPGDLVLKMGYPGPLFCPEAPTCRSPPRHGPRRDIRRILD
jgi:S1-C subfamily serine protease